MGTRRGQQRQQESDAFEAANPFLTRVNTRLEVERTEEPFEPDNIGFQIQQVEEEEPGLLFPRVTQDGAPGEVDVVDFWPLEPSFSTAFAVETPVGFMFSLDGFQQGPGNLFNSSVSMTDYGFGVISDEEFEEGDEEGAFALDEDELLAFIISDQLFGPGDAFDGYDYPIGGVKIGLDYMVLGGSGALEVFLLDDDEAGRSETPDAASGPLSEGDTGSLDASLDDLFFGGVIGVSGSLEVAIVGIDVKTNFAGSLVDLGDIFE